jgi:hypothetical protein
MASFDAESGVHYVRRVKQSNRSDQSSKYLNQERYIRVFVEIGEWLLFANCRACFDADCGVHYVRPVKKCKRRDQTSKCLNQERNIRVLVYIDKWRRLASRRDCFDAKSGLHYVRRAKWCENGDKLRNAAIKNEISEFSSKQANACFLQIAGLVSTLKAASNTIGVLLREKRAVNFEMSLLGTKYNRFRPNRRMIAFCELQVMFRR